MTRISPSERPILCAALEAYGGDAQQKMLLEEMSELQKEICKHWRGRQNLQEIAEEMADVQIMLDQMTLFFQNGGLQEQYRLKKLERLGDRLGLIP